MVAVFTVLLWGQAIFGRLKRIRQEVNKVRWLEDYWLPQGGGDNI